MLLPSHLPSEQMLSKWMAEHFNGELAGSSLASVAAATNLAMAEVISRALEAIHCTPQLAEDSHSQSEDTAHDTYFHIARVKNEQCAAFVRTVCVARLIFLSEVDESPVSVSCEFLNSIDNAFADLISCLSGGQVKGTPRVTIFRSRGVNSRPMTRWVRGHQLFAALTQGLIFAFQATAEAIRFGNHDKLERWVDLSISLLRGSSAVFSLTGDFSVEDYTATIRPSMMPPACPVSLSGLMSFDHRFLSQIMRDMRPALKALHELDPSRHDSLAQALSAVYDSHIHVCERFVGNKPSILTTGRTEKSGPSLVQQFKTLRLKPFEQPVRAIRLVPTPTQRSSGEYSPPE